MKITRYLYLLFIIALYVLNYFYLKIAIFPFTGIVLGILVVLIVGINIYARLRDRKRGKNEDDFIFPTQVANTMKLVDIGTQYEASMISMVFLMLGIVLFLIYMVFLTPYSWIMKGFTAFNSICALVLMLSMLITNYQQYKSYKDSTKLFGQFANTMGTEVVTEDKLMSPLEAYGFPPRGISDEEKKKVWDKIAEETKEEPIIALMPENDKVIDLTNVSDKDMIEKIFNKNNERRQID